MSRCVGDGSVGSGVVVTCGSSSLGDPCSELSFGSSGCHSGVSGWVCGVGFASGGVGEICDLGVGWGSGGVARTAVASKWRGAAVVLCKRWIGGVRGGAWFGAYNILSISVRGSNS